MAIQTLIFGAIGALAETSDLQREAFNQSFKNAGMDWEWSRELYQDLLSVNGGQKRILSYAKRVGLELSSADIAELHQSKTNIYAKHLESKGLDPRPGIASVIETAQGMGIKVGLASTTSPQNIDAILNNLNQVNRSQFDFILTGEDVDKVKPDPDVYELAVQRAACPTHNICVIEDTPVSATAAAAAGLRVFIYPGRFVAHQDMSVAAHILTPQDINIERLNALMT